MWNMFKVTNKDTRTTQVNTGWVTPLIPYHTRAIYFFIPWLSKKIIRSLYLLRNATTNVLISVSSDGEYIVTVHYLLSRLWFIWNIRFVSTYYHMVFRAYLMTFLYHMFIWQVPHYLRKQLLRNQVLQNITTSPFQCIRKEAL